MIDEEISEMETNRTVHKIFTKVVFKKKQKLTNPLPIKSKERAGQNEWNLWKWDDIIHSSEIQRIMREYFENLSFKNLKNSIEIDKHLETYDLLKLNQEVTNNLGRSIIKNKTEAVITVPNKERIRARWSHW